MHLLAQHILFVIPLIIGEIKLITSLECAGKAKICEDLSKSQCEDCILADACCLWIYKKDINNVSRCTVESNLPPNLKNQIIKSEESYVKITEDKNFSTPISDFNKLNDDEPSVQIKPQKIDVTLRLGDPITTKLSYKAIKNYPLDIYYLMDLTYSMKPHREQLSKLGNKLTEVLQNLTENYRIAFGFYSDKVALPYYQMSETVLKNPCHTENLVCETGYNFKHAYNFSKNLLEFTQKVNESMHTANNDDLESGFDALQQIMLCKKELGWRNHARKIIIIATDSLMHTAGDGILAGITKRADSQCRLENTGKYMVYTGADYDYPSIGEIHSKLIENKMNVLFAVDKKVEEYYKLINELMPDVTKVGFLDNDPENILRLVRKAYTEIVETVKLQIKNPKRNLNITFTPYECRNNELFYTNETKCSNITVGKEYNFGINIELLKIPKNKRMSDKIIIEEMNIKEMLEINVIYVGSHCNCPDLIDGKNIINGRYRCGKYDCNNGWIGEKCDKKCDQSYGRLVNDTYISSTCFHRGEFDIDVCECDCDPGYIGKYCEFNQCPKNSKGEICSNHGVCHEGFCVCNKDYAGTICNCLKSNTTCIKPGSDIICSNHGECECGKCECKSTFVSNYGGQFCEKCINCENLCKTFNDEVSAAVSNNSWTQNYIHEIIKVDNFNETDIDWSCLHIFYDSKGLKHSVKYTYEMESSGLQVIIYYVEEIIEPINQATVGAFIASIVLCSLLLFLFCFRGYIYYLDKKEWKVFQISLKETKYNENNPLYKSPITKFRNPMVPSKSNETLDGNYK